MKKFFQINKNIILLFAIILLGAFFRFYNLNWDQNNHLHPDERAIIMFTLPLQFPSSFSEFLSTDSPLNTHFFAYGNFPLYLLKATGGLLSQINPFLGSYDGITIVGRFISSFFDLGTIILIFFIGKSLFSKTIGLLASFFYALSVLPIQLAHFYAVDSTLTFFITLALFQIIKFYEKPALKKALLVGVFFGLALATKTSALAIIASIGTALIADFLLIFIKNPHTPKIWYPHLPKFLKKLFVEGAIIIATAIITFIIIEPYAVIDFNNFLRQTLEQSRMTKDAFTFPYTLQYVGKIPYFHEIKNIFLWGLGPILASLSFIGIINFIVHIVKKKKKGKWAQELIIITFFLVYFGVVGSFAVGWIRYMLPLYPLLCLFGAVFAYKLLSGLKTYLINHKFLFFILNSSFLILIFVWPLSFIHIYDQPNTRALASDWIYKNVDENKTISREHWDDGLPFGQNIEYNLQELKIYDFRNPIIKDEIYQKVNQSDYIIIASNRLYTPLQRIAENCIDWNIPTDMCPKDAEEYYKKLFSGKLGFKKVAEFENPPVIPFLNIKINDQSADESFTVYDHPKVMIFKKLND